jgi:hypothetical protein
LVCFIRRRWAHNSTYADAATPRTVQILMLAAGTSVIVDGFIDVFWNIMTEARRDSCSVIDRKMSILLGNLFMACDACVT